MIASHPALFLAVGFTIFCVGVLGRMYILLRIRAEEGVLASEKGLTSRYKALIRNGDAPGWPILVESVCVPLGIALLFGAILLSPPAP